MIVQSLAEFLVFKAPELLHLIYLLTDVSVVLEDDLDLCLLVLSKGRSGLIVYVFEIVIINCRSLQDICKALIWSLFEFLFLSFELLQFIRITAAFSFR